MTTPPRTLLTLTWLLGCAGKDGAVSPPPPDTGAPDDSADTAGAPAVQDILSTDLVLDLSALSGVATVVVQPAGDSVTLDVSGLTLGQVTVDGVAVEAAVHDGIATVPVSGAAPVSVGLTYTFQARTVDTFDGWMPDLGVSFLWPNACSNLYPCDPWPDDGLTVTMQVTRVDPSLTAIYPPSTVGDGPSYMPGIAVGDYEQLDLGATSAGTTLHAWYLAGAGNAEDARFGTAHLVDAVDYFERTYGPYPFGADAGTVQVDWGADSYGGMEHHPYVHVGKFDFWNEEAQVHEMAHAWFGDGVRLACWEDFVLSEGTTTYLAARGLEEVGGPDLWPSYVDDFLTPICTGLDINAIVLPDSCDEIDFENDRLWSLAPYMKGACFYEDVADLIGPDVLDAAIAAFYQEHVGQAARMRDMIDRIEATADPAQTEAIEQLVTDWLLTLDCPADYETRCRSHTR